MGPAAGRGGHRRDGSIVDVCWAASTTVQLGEITGGPEELLAVSLTRSSLVDLR